LGSWVQDSGLGLGVCYSVNGGLGLRVSGLKKKKIKGKRKNYVIAYTCVIRVSEIAAEKVSFDSW
jgi:hypothetical protein